ncbi:MAG: hypothetical protein ACLUVG_24040 [Phocaeicola vulgatus]
MRSQTGSTTSNHISNLAYNVLLFLSGSIKLFLPFLSMLRQWILLTSFFNVSISACTALIASAFCICNSLVCSGFAAAAASPAAFAAVSAAVALAKSDSLASFAAGS